MRRIRHGVHVLVASVLVAGAISGTAVLLVVPLGADLDRPELPPATTTEHDRARTRSADERVLVPPMSAQTPPVHVTPGTLTEANDVGDPTFVPPRGKSRATPSTAPPATLPAPRSTSDRWEVASTVYCLTGTTASGEPVRRGIVAVNSARFAELDGTAWRVIEGPPEIVGQTFTVRDKGPAAEFDVWMGDRPDCPTWGRYTYGRKRAVVVPA